MEQQGEDADQGVDPHLGEQAGEAAPTPPPAACGTRPAARRTAGTTAALMLNAIRNSIATRPSTPGVLIVPASTRASSAMLSVPVAP